MRHVGLGLRGSSGLEGYHDTRSYPHASLLPGLVIYRFDGPLFFAKRRDIPRSDQKARGRRPAADIDTTASDVLTDFDEDLNDRGISLVFAELKDPVRAKIERYGLTRTIDPEHFYPTLEAAIAAFRAKTGVRWTSPSR